MDRRRFLRNLVATTGALALGPALLRGGPAVAGDSAAFATGLQRHPWLAGWQSVASPVLPRTALEIEGRLPEGFAGTLYRNGPALFDRAGFRYEHWFDGDGMVHAWRFGADRTLSHQARMVATPKFVREQQAGRFRVMAAGTRVPDADPVRNNDEANPANTSVMHVGNRLFALCEAGSAFELDPDSLDTLGPVTWRPDLAALPFSAHPLRDADGSTWNFGSLSMLGGQGLLVWHLGADGTLASASVLETPVPGYLHGFAMTARHLVFVLMPFRMAEQGAFFERLQFLADQPCQVAVVDKDTPGQARWFEVPFAAVYHFADAWQDGGEIVVRAVRHADPVAARSPMQAAMNGRADGSHSRSDLADLRLDLRSGTARWDPTGIDELEFPVFDPRSRGDRGARIYAPTSAGARATPAFNAIAAIDVAAGRRQVHRYGAAVMAEEHVFVPRPGSRHADDGWLVGTLLDSARGRSGIAVLDAARLGDGPLAQAWLPHTVPLGFHGHFAAAA